jgi:molybdate transport system regulatory protein
MARRDAIHFQNFLICLELSAMKNKSRKYSLRPRFRILCGTVIAFGPGKADLLEALQKTGSITEASARLRMSYMRAWTLIRTMNQCFEEPLVIAIRGGTRGGGGASLSGTGRQVLALYRQMETKCLESVQPDWRKFEKLLKMEAGPRK